MHALDGSAHLAHVLYRFAIQLFLFDEKLADGDRRGERIHVMPTDVRLNLHKQIDKLFVCSSSLKTLIDFCSLLSNLPHRVVAVFFLLGGALVLRPWEALTVLCELKPV